MTNLVDIRPDHLRIVQDGLRDHLPAGVKVWVFGSRAQWSAREGSDLDLALEGEAEIDRKVMDALVDAFEDSDLPYTVDVVDINRISKQFRQIVDSHKVSLSLGTGRGEVTEWTTMPFSEAVTVNPPVRLERGSCYPFVDMAAVNPGSRWSYAVAQRKFSGGGSRFQHGDTLMARITPCLENGKVALYRSIDDVSVAHGSTEFIVIRGRPDVTDDDFAYYLTQSPEVRSHAISQMTGTSGRQRVPVSALDHVDVPVPPLPEQRAIAHVLGTLDDKIELNRRMNGTLEEMARALFRSWFVDFDPVRAKMDGRWRGGESLPGLPTELYDLFPDRLAQTNTGDVPQGWKLGALTDMVVLLSGGTPKTSITEYWNGNIPWYTAKDAPSLSDVFVVDAERRISQAGIDNSSTQILPAGTTVITARGTVGRLACLGIPMAMNQTCYGIRGMDDYPDFFTYWNVRMAITELQARTHGTIFDTITRQTFRLVNVVIPPLVLATAFETEVAAFMSPILANLQASRNLAALRDLLLPNLMSSGLRELYVPA